MDQAGLTSLLREHVTRHSLPGASLGVLRDGGVTIACHGVGNLVTGEPITRGSPTATMARSRGWLRTLPAQRRLRGRWSWSYTNVGWCLLGRALETATGAPWEIAMARLLDFAGLSDTTFGVDAARHPRVTGYDATPGPTAVVPLVSRSYGPAGASAVSSAADLLRFAGWHLDDPSVAVLRESHADVAIHGWLDSWCLGWARFDWPGGPVWGWDSLIRGERAVLRLLPEHRAAVVLLTNSAAGRAAYHSLFSELMPLLFGVEVAPLRLDASPAAVGDLSRFAGV